MSEPRGRLENRAEVSKTFGISVVTLDGWVRDGCPIFRKGGRGVAFQFDTAEVSAWREQRAADVALGGLDKTDVEEAKRRRITAQASILEIQLALKRGELFPVRQMAEFMGRVFSAVRERVLAVSGKMAGDLDAEQAERLDAEIYEALEELTNAPDTISGGASGLRGADAGDDEAVEAAPAPKSSRVGRAVSVRSSKDQRGARKVENKRPANRIRTNDGGDRT